MGERPPRRGPLALRLLRLLSAVSLFALLGGTGGAFAQQAGEATYRASGGERTVVLTALTAPAGNAVAANLASTIISSVALMMRLTGSITVDRADFLTPTLSFARARKYYSLVKADGAVFGSIEPASGGGYSVSLEVWNASSDKKPTELRRMIRNPLSSFALADRLALEVASTVVGRTLTEGTLILENAPLLPRFAIYADGHLVARNRARLRLLTGKHEIVVAKSGGPLGDIPVEVFRVDIRQGKQAVIRLTRTSAAPAAATRASPVIYAGTLQGLSVTTNGGTSWTRFGALSGIPPGRVSAIVLAPGEIYAATTQGLAVSPDGGASWATDSRGYGLAPNVINDMAVQGGVIYAATAAGLCIGRDSGSRWSCYDAADGLAANQVQGVAVSGSSVYAATSEGLSVSGDGGQSWHTDTAADGLGSSVVNGVFARGGAVYAATGQGLSISADRGLHWTTFSASDGLASNQVAGVYADGGDIYAATAAGLSVSVDGGAHWETYTALNGLASNTVNAVFAVGSTIYAATANGLSVSRDGGADWSTYFSSNPFGSAYVLSVVAPQAGGAPAAAQQAGTSSGRP